MRTSNSKIQKSVRSLKKQNCSSDPHELGTHPQWEDTETINPVANNHHEECSLHL